MSPALVGTGGSEDSCLTNDEFVVRSGFRCRCRGGAVKAAAFGFQPVYSPSKLSEQEVPMPVSPLSEAMLCLLIWLLRLLDGPVVACQCDSVPGNHPDEEYSGPADKFQSQLHTM
uniref:Uncharacterized protein n=1 Tax=Sphaerodactylus townsendi TaxID=933632 RepID=A0ACB8GCV7_9SAUR